MRDISIVVDPFVFALPEPEGPEQLIAFIDRLRAWSAGLKRVGACTSERAVAELQMTAVYPSRQRIGELLRRFQVDSYSLNDVANALRVLSEREPFLEALTGISEVCNDTQIEPDSAITRLPMDTGRAWQSALVGLLIHCTDELCCAPAVGTADLVEPSIALTGSVTLVERSDGTLDEREHRIRASLSVCLEPPRPPAQTWEQVMSRPLEAIAYVYREGAAQGDHVDLDLSRIRVGPHFELSIREVGIVGPPLRTLYRRCADAALGRLARICGAKLHPVRTSEAAGAPQVKRPPGDSLWRCMVTQHGAGYRLHFWELTDGGIELDRVLVESEV